MGLLALSLVGLLLWWLGASWSPSDSRAEGFVPGDPASSVSTTESEGPAAKLLQPKVAERVTGTAELDSGPLDPSVLAAVQEALARGESPELPPGKSLLSIRLAGWAQGKRALPVLVEVWANEETLIAKVGLASQTFLISDLAPGSYQVEAWTLSDPRLRSRVETVEILPNQQHTKLEVALLPRPVLRGTVVSRNGTPLTDYRLTAIHSDSQGEREAQHFLDPLGVFAVYPSLSMPFEVRIDAPGHLTFTQSAELGVGEVRWVQWALEPQRPVGGIVRWPDGTPAADVSVFGRTDREGDQVSSDVDGRFTLDALSLRDLKLYARGGGESGQDFSNRWSFHESEDLTQLDLWLQPSAEYRARVLTDGGAAVAGQRLMLLAVDNRRVTRFGTTDDEGRVTVSGLYPGTYTVIFDRYEQALTEITVQPGEVLPEQLLRLPTDLSDKLRQAASPPREW